MGIMDMENEMKLYKLALYGSLVIVAFALLLLAFTPFTSPDSSIAWKSYILILSPAVALAALLFVAPRLSKRAFLFTTILFSAVAILLTFARWLPTILLGIFLVACFALYLSRQAPRSDLHY